MPPYHRRRLETSRLAFLAPSGEAAHWTPVSPRRSVRVHVRHARGGSKSAREDENLTKGSKNANPVADRQVFRYVSLDPGQRFVTHVMFVQHIWQQCLSSCRRRLGGSRAGYGRVRIRAERVSTAVEASPPAASHPFAVLLLTPLIARDSVTGTPTRDPAAAAAALSDVLGTRTTLRYSFPTSGMAEGFNRKWGLPLPQTPALTAGTVLVLEADQAIEDLAWKRLLLMGAGERTAEGYGAVVLPIRPRTSNGSLPPPARKAAAAPN